MTLGQPLNSQELEVLLAAAGGRLRTATGAQSGRLVMRGLIAADEDGQFSITDAGLQALADRADELAGCTEGSEEEAELARIADVLEGLGK